jgi:signal transduction histidine kinase
MMMDWVVPGQNMQLADFILANIEPILVDWVAFARGISPGQVMDKLALRDHAAQILQATARDMMRYQSANQQSEKSKGLGVADESVRLNGASEEHAVGRVDSGFNMVEVVAEYRALRASVIRLWRKSASAPELSDLEELIRFNESIDQSLTTAVKSYTERVDRSRRMFLAILGHDLRNPLNALKLSANVLSLSGELNADSSAVASQMCATATAMGEMIDDLLDFTGTGVGVAMSISLAAMDLKPLCAEVVDEMRAAHPSRTVLFEACDQCSGQWDAGRLRQVISNLLGNAFQHGDGPVEIRVSTDGGEVLLAIRNQGAPIPPEALATIFDPLVRGPAKPGKQRRPGSIGLGLYIAREVVTAHGGAIEVHSSQAGGTVFTVRLPRHRSMT